MAPRMNCMIVVNLGAMGIFISTIISETIVNLVPRL